MSEPTRWQRVRTLFAELVELAPEQRSAALERQCHGDAELRRELESLLAKSGGDELSPLAPAARTLGPFALVRALPAGRHGRVHLARAEGLGAEVALRIVPLANDGLATVQRMRGVSAELTALRHPALAGVLECGLCAGREAPGALALYVASEYVPDAVALAAHAAPLPLRARLELLVALALGVTHAHARGTSHGDLAANLVVDAQGRARVLDMGLARVLAEPVADGMRTDVRALGAVLRGWLEAPAERDAMLARAALPLAQRANAEHGEPEPLGAWAAQLAAL